MAKSPKAPTTTDYIIGHGKPPAHTRFAKGQSGNPGGRKKDSPNMKTILKGVLEQQIVVTENGKKRCISMLEALLKCQVKKGLEGSDRALRDLFDRYERHESATAGQTAELPDDDQAILSRVMRLASSRTTPTVRDYEADAKSDDGDDE